MGDEVGPEHKGKVRCKEKPRKKNEKVRMKVTERKRQAGLVAIQTDSV